MGRRSDPPGGGRAGHDRADPAGRRSATGDPARPPRGARRAARRSRSRSSRPSSRTATTPSSSSGSRSWTIPTSPSDASSRCIRVLRTTISSSTAACSSRSSRTRSARLTWMRGGSSCAAGSCPDPVAGKAEVTAPALRQGAPVPGGTLNRRARRRLHPGTPCVRVAHRAEAPGHRAREGARAPPPQLPGHDTSSQRPGRRRPVRRRPGDGAPRGRRRRGARGCLWRPQARPHRRA